MAKDPYMCDTIPNSPPPPKTAWISSHACVKPYLLPIPPPPSVCRASKGFCWTVTAYTAYTAYTVLSRAGMAQGFAGRARLIPPSERPARCYRKGEWGGGGVDDHTHTQTITNIASHKCNTQMSSIIY